VKGASAATIRNPRPVLEQQAGSGDVLMCRSIKTLFNYDPAAGDDEIQASALQYVRKVSGFRQPSRSNQAAFERAVRDIARVTRQLLESLETTSPPRNRAAELARARAKARQRFGQPSRG
jgi:hypothetical protein